jgi:hypothetical protein
MKNTFELAVAVEKFIHYKDFTWSFRAGYRMDIQPIRSPEVTLHWFTAGINVIVGNASIHMAAAVIMGDEEAWDHSDTILSISTDFFL